MSSPHGRSEIDALATEVMIATLAVIAVGPTPLLIGAMPSPGEPTSALAAALSASGAVPQRWNRRLWQATKATPWPEPGPYTSALIRLPKSKDELDFALDAAASVLPTDASIVVYGHNDEGVRSAAAHLAPFVETVETLATRRHCRVIAGRRRSMIADLRGRLELWRREITIDLGAGSRRWITYPGLFARGGLDPATALLLVHVPKLAPGARVLDFATGTGIIAAALLERQPDLSIDAIDNDALAIEAARENVPSARAIVGNDLASVGAERYDLIVSNPPIHDGVTESHGVLDKLIADAPRHLTNAGALILVVQRRIDVQKTLFEAFGNAEVVARDAQFTVWRARGNTPPTPRTTRADRGLQDRKREIVKTKK
jgi:16S rRNA (guanine1207-N2)-methyltransferase